MTDVWIARDGERHGPYPEDEIRHWVHSGRLTADDLAWKEGLSDWQPLRTLFPDLAPAASPPIAPPRAEPASRPPGPAAARSVHEYASFWSRSGAWLIDYFILSLPTILAAHLMGTDKLIWEMSQLMAQLGGSIDEENMRRLYAYTAQLRPFAIVSTLIGFAYYVLLEASPWQATLGKLACRIRVTDLAGQRLGLGRSAMRNLVRLTNIVTPFIPLACYLPIAWTQRRQGLHDQLAQALVLYGRAR